MTDQHSIVPRRVQPPIDGVVQLRIHQHLAAFEREDFV
jgi:hypothetical protein